MNEQDAKKSLREVLQALPKDTDEIARYLELKGISGRQRDAGRCPISLYCQDAFAGVDDVWNVLVSVGTVFVYSYDGERVSVSLPPHVAAFISRFDEGRYPFLQELSRHVASHKTFEEES